MINTLCDSDLEQHYEMKLAALEIICSVYWLQYHYN